jgi:hypothetical protein
MNKKIFRVDTEKDEHYLVVALNEDEASRAVSGRNLLY